MISLRLSHASTTLLSNNQHSTNTQVFPNQLRAAGMLEHIYGGCKPPPSLSLEIHTQTKQLQDHKLGINLVADIS